MYKVDTAHMKRRTDWNAETPLETWQWLLGDDLAATLLKQTRVLVSSLNPIIEERLDKVSDTIMSLIENIQAALISDQ